MLKRPGRRPLRGFCLRLAHHLLAWRITPLGLMGISMLSALVTLPLNYFRLGIAATVALALCCLFIAGSMFVTSALGRSGAAERYLHYATLVLLRLAVAGGLVLNAPQYLLPAASLLIAALVLEGERFIFVELHRERRLGKSRREGPLARLIAWLVQRPGQILVLAGASLYPPVLLWGAYLLVPLSFLLFIRRGVIGYRLIRACERPLPALERRQQELFD